MFPISFLCTCAQAESNNARVTCAICVRDLRDLFRLSNLGMSFHQEDLDSFFEGCIEAGLSFSVHVVVSKRTEQRGCEFCGIAEAS